MLGLILGWMIARDTARVDQQLCLCSAGQLMGLILGWMIARDTAKVDQ